MTGVEFSFPYTMQTLLIGQRASESIKATFNETNSWIGFYGSQGDDRIYTLGWLVQDITCSEPKEVVAP